jgi:hypothetical protein
MRAPLLAILLAPSLAGAAVSLGPYLQDARPGSIVVAWECAPRSPGAVIVRLADGERRLESPEAEHHEVRVPLQPGRFPYRVACGTDESPAHSLAAPPAGGSFTFLVYGDNRDRDAEHERVVRAMAAERADLVLQTGDMTGDAAEDPLWRRFFTIEEPLLAEAPMFPALGNHELVHDPTAAHFHRYFALPPVAGAAAPAEERWYSFRFGNARFIALDGNQSHSRPQAEWLLAQLDAARADPGVQHLFVFFHQPPFSVGDFCGSAAEQGLWVPELEQAASPEGGGKLRAVFTGHDHSYQHLERNGVRYFVTGGGGAPLHKQTAHCPPYDRAAARLFRDLYHYLRVRVRESAAELEAVSVDGEVIERVALHEPPAVEREEPPEVPYAEAPLRAVARRRGSPARRLIPTAVTLALLLGAAVAITAFARRRR